MESRWHRLLSAPIVLAVVAMLALAGCAPTPPSNSEPVASTPATPGGASSDSEPSAPEVIVSGLWAPWSIAFHDGIALVSERDSARILELTPEGELREVATIPGVAPRGEAGLLGIAVNDGHLYAYSTAERENRIQRFPITGQVGALVLGDPEVVLDGIPAASYHDGGRIAFGPDGMLYATTGDAGATGNAQDLDSLGGKILRLTPTGGIPADNPFPGSVVYSYGHRNPQGLAWAPDGSLYASELGQDTWDELNIIEPGGNYGWPEAEGIAGQAGYIDPVQQWAPDDASPSGIAIAGGTIHIANLRGERLRTIPLDDVTASRELLAGEYGRLRDVVTAPDGSLWVLTNNTAGRGTPAPDDDRILRLTLGN